MRRQRIRKGLILISFLLFPVTIFYFSPYLIIQGASKGIITGSFVVFSLMFLFSLVFGRAYCGWVCPSGGLQECCMAVSDKRAKGGRLNWIKYFIWVPWISGIILIFAYSGGIKKVDFLYRTNHGISVSSPPAYIIFYGVILLTVVLAFAGGKRSACHYICWMAPFMILGTKVKDALKLPSLHLAAEKERCINCKLCSKKCPMSLDVHGMVQGKNMRNSECILCGECIDACPKHVIKFSWKK